MVTYHLQKRGADRKSRFDEIDEKKQLHVSLHGLNRRWKYLHHGKTLH